MLNPEELIVFTRIATTGSLSAAARELGLSLTAVSRRLSALEAGLQLRLFNRTSRHVSLTDDGLSLMPMAQDILDRLADAEASLKNRSTHAEGVLRVTATIAFASRQIAPRLGRFLLEHPELRIQLIATDSMLDIVQDNIDLAIRQAVLPDSDLISRVLAPDRRVLVASPEYVARHGMPARPQDLARHCCIVLGDPPVTTWRFERGARKVAVEVGWTLLLNDGGSAQEACLGGAGIALKSIWDAREDLEQGRLVELLPGWMPPVMPIHAVFASRHQRAARVSTFVEFLQKELHREVLTHPVISQA
jgi:DNA-binding transcriptional LysR family regulator